MRMKVKFIAIALALFIIPLMLLGAQKSPSQELEPYKTIMAVAERLTPSVVNIEVSVPRDSVPAQVLGAERRGTGVIIDREGNTVTASHVVIGANRLEVTLSDGRRFPAKMVGIDSETGLGLIRVLGTDLVAAPLGSSKTIRVGELALVIGSAGGMERVVNHGIISSLRPFIGYWEYMLNTAIHTSVPITPGFSGSPLLNARGQVVGIISFSNPQAQNENIAVPIDLFHEIKADLIAYGEPKRAQPRPWLGLSSVSINGGMLVTGVTPGGPASKSGIKPKDIITEVNGKKVSNQREYYEQVWKGNVGDEVKLAVEREDQNFTVTVKSSARNQYLGNRD